MYMANPFKSQEATELQKTLADKREALRAFRFGAAGSRSRTNAVGKVLRCAPGYCVRGRIHKIENFDCLSHAICILKLVPGASIAPQ